MTNLSLDSSLVAYVDFLKRHLLHELAVENLRLLRELDVPLMQLFAAMPEHELLQLTADGLEAFLGDLSAGRALEVATETLRQWERDELPGIPKEAIVPSDLVLVNAAQKAAILSFLDRFTSEMATALAVVAALEHHYMLAQRDAFLVFTRLRDEAARQAAHAEAERVVAVQAAEEVQALNEELQAQAEELHAQAEELHSQQEELAEVHLRLQQQNARAEAEVVARTRELEAQRALLDGVLNNLPGAVGYCDRDFVIRVVNRDYAAQLGQTPEALVGRHAREVFGVEAFADIEARTRGLFESGESWREFGVSAVDASGREFFQDFAVVPVHDASGQVTGLLSLSIDVSERVRLAREVASQTQQIDRQQLLMERVIEQAPAGIAFLDGDLVVRWLNPEFLSLFQRPAEYFLDRSFFEYAAPELRERFEPVMRDALRGGEPIELHAVAVPLARQGGEVVETHWDFTYAPVLGHEGAVEGLLLFALEVSSAVERERLQQGQIAELKQLDRMKDDFLGALSYQLGTPMHAIMGFASVLDEGAVGNLQPQQIPYVKRILATSAIQLALVNDLLDLSRMSGGKFVLDAHPTSLTMLAEKALNHLWPLTEQQSLRMIQYLPHGLPPVLADEQRIEQVLFNLMHGAIKLSPPGGLVRVQVSVEERALRFEVQDSGVCLSPAEATQVFERYTQLRGTWLGLSIAKAIVEAHTGTIGVTSQAGMGNTFWFTLPLAA